MLTTFHAAIQRQLVILLTRVAFGGVDSDFREVNILLTRVAFSGVDSDFHEVDVSLMRGDRLIDY